MTLEATVVMWKKKPAYKYCTKKMVDKAVKQGREAVIKCASDKWWFFGTCTEKQLGYYLGIRGIGGNCSLCREFSCSSCPLKLSLKVGCRAGRTTLYQQSVRLVYGWQRNPTATNFKKFQVKARKLARVIGRLK